LGELVTCGDVRQMDGRRKEGCAWQRISKPFLVVSVLGLIAGAFAKQHQNRLLSGVSFPDCMASFLD